MLPCLSTFDLYRVHTPKRVFSRGTRVREETEATRSEGESFERIWDALHKWAPNSRTLFPRAAPPPHPLREKTQGSVLAVLATR